MTTQHIETLVIGAGQAGLSSGYHLQQRGQDFLIVDDSERVGDNWRKQYDSLTLFTPAKADSLDGLPFPDDPWHFPTKDEMADYLELYAVTFDLPVRLQTRVQRLTRDGDHFVADLDGLLITCDNVVIATGTFGRTPYVPAFAGELDSRIVQLHSSEYRRPAQLPEGPVLVVGASHSGLDIAYELGASRTTTLVGPARGRVPLEWGTRSLKLAFPLIELTFNHVLTRRTPMGRKVMANIRHHGAPQLRVKRHHLEERGVEWVEDHVTGVTPDGIPRLGDGRALDAAAVVWATGFRQVYDWVDVPLEIQEGWPSEYRGVVGSSPGLFFCGLAFQYAFASGEVNGVGRDAAYVARRIAARTRAATPAVA
jgi:putative flavoprotein involved in K+ transport